VENGYNDSTLAPVGGDGGGKSSVYQTHHPAVIVVLCILYAILSLIAFTGNALVIWIIGQKRNHN
jgi:hypothetical protein